MSPSWWKSTMVESATTSVSTKCSLLMDRLSLGFTFLYFSRLMSDCFSLGIFILSSLCFCIFSCTFSLPN